MSLVVKKGTTIFCLFEELVVKRGPHHSEFMIRGLATGGHVTIHFSARRSEEEPKVHNLDPNKKYLVLCRNVQHRDETHFWLRSVLSYSWDNNFIQFMEVKWHNFLSHQTLKIVPEASVFPLNMPEKRKYVFPLLKDDYFIVSDLLVPGIILPDYDF